MGIDFTSVYASNSDGDDGKKKRKPAPRAKRTKAASGASIYSKAHPRPEQAEPQKVVEPPRRRPARKPREDAEPKEAAEEKPKRARRSRGDNESAGEKPKRSRRSRGDNESADEKPKRSRRSRGDDPEAEKPKRRRRGKSDEAKERSARLAMRRAAPLDPDGDYGGEFQKFELAPEILKAIHDLGWEKPSEIQERVIPLVLEGRDVVGQARTGTGKTGAFVIPTLARYHDRGVDRSRTPVMLCLAPTRELAIQVHRQVEQLSVYTKLTSVAVYGGAPMEPQLRALRNGCDLVVGTPGRVMDHIRRGTLKLDTLLCFVLDEADRMFDLGFRDDIYWVSRRLPEEGRQTLLLSATMPKEVLRLAKEVTSDPVEIYTSQHGEDAMTVEKVEQFYIAVSGQRKMGLLTHLVKAEDPEKGIVFTRTKRGADKVAERLRKAGFDAGEIHSDLRQKQRERILERFREGNLHLMIATDVAARGLDIQGVTHVFNFDVPENAEDYVHRVGRTARMGKSGRAFTFVTTRDGGFLTEIEKLINKEVPAFPVEGYRTDATPEEIAASADRAPSQHPMAGKLSPALLNILERSSRGRGGGKGGGGRGDKGGGRKGRGRGGKR